MNLQRISELAASGSISFNPSDDLPLPNIYWVTVTHHEGHSVNAYIAADHTKLAIHKVANHCADHHGFRPYRSNSAIKVRRMLLGDLINDPSVYDKALQHASSNCESDIVSGLRQLPGWIARHVGGDGYAPVNTAALGDLWERLSAEVEAQAPIRVLRPAISA